MEIGDKNVNYLFALYSNMFEEGSLEADITGHEKVLLADNTYCEWNRKFAQEVSGANIDAHRNIVMASGNIYEINQFIEDIDKKILGSLSYHI